MQMQIYCHHHRGHNNDDNLCHLLSNDHDHHLLSHDHYHHLSHGHDHHLISHDHDHKKTLLLHLPVVETPHLDNITGTVRI